ncbi:endonuclease VIII [Clostridiaceae bacterium M8S5]|nr:endonuclease VIII [Clostridiaceae bacterium M8S5]
MIELPEAIVLSKQIYNTLKGKKIKNVIANQSPHKFAWFYGEPSKYRLRLKDKSIENVNVYGSFIEVILGTTKLLLAEGISARYIEKGEKLPQKHQLLLEFEDGSFFVVSIRMYGGIWCYENDEFDYEYLQVAKEKPSPFTEGFDYKYYHKIISDENLQKKSVKALLATEQRIPGLGNGVLQDILYNVKIHPKRKVQTLSDNEVKELYYSIKDTLDEMEQKGGRDTEKDLFGKAGGYRTKLSKNTLSKPCSICGGKIHKKAYLGGSIYYCESCQIEK